MLTVLQHQKFYLGTPMECDENIFLPINTITEGGGGYNPRAMEKNGHVFFDIRKGMYGLTQAIK